MYIAAILGGGWANGRAGDIHPGAIASALLARVTPAFARIGKSAADAEIRPLRPEQRHFPWLQLR